MRPLYISLVLFVFIAVGSYVARATGWYNGYWFTDVILHITAGVMFGCFWIWMTRHEKTSNIWIQILTIISFATAASVLWEFWEFSGWKIMPTHTRFYIPDLGDTLSDILCGMGGGTAVAVFRLFQAKKYV